MSTVVRKGILELTTRVEVYACVDEFASQREIDDKLMEAWTRGEGHELECFPDNLDIKDYYEGDQRELDCEG